MSVSSIEQKVGDFTRRISFTTAFDKRDPNPGKDYGIGAVRIFFYLIGEKGAVNWTIGTNWYPRANQREDPRIMNMSFTGTEPSAWDLGYHAKEPFYEGQWSRDDCDVIGGKCYYDGSTLNAEQHLDTFLEQGLDAIWVMLEQYYHDTFDETD
jgi:hypothetical protein